HPAGPVPRGDDVDPAVAANPRARRLDSPRSRDGRRLDGVPRSACARGAVVRGAVARPHCEEEAIVSDARETILGRLERAVRTGRIPDSPRADGAAPQADAARAGSVADQFIVEARALGVEVFVEWSADAVRDRLGTLTNGMRALAWHPDRLPYKSGASLGGAMMAPAPRSDQGPAHGGRTRCPGPTAGARAAR